MYDITIQLATASDGSIDRAASLADFDAAVTKFIADLEVENAQISEKVTEFFETNKGKRIALPTVCALVAQALNSQPENHSSLTERVADYLRANSQGKTNKADGTVERPDSKFIVSKGAGGGVGVRADLPAPAPKTIESK